MFFANLLLAGTAGLYGAGTAGGTLLGSETDGLAADFTSTTVDLLIRDATAVLNYSGTPFANDGGKLTFSRTSLATVTDSDGYIKWAPHNLLPYSQAFNSWGANNATVTANATTAPDGTTTADLMVANTSTISHRVVQSYTTASVEFTFSVWAKAGGWDFFSLDIYNNSSGNHRAGFNLGSGTIGTIDAGTTASITSAGNGWYLCKITANSVAGSSGEALINQRASATDFTDFAGDGTNGIYLWGSAFYRSDLGGMQSNGSAYPTYNPTTSAAYYGPRIDHTSAGVKRGLLMEEARTNLCLQSNDLTNASWTKSNMSTAKTATGPDNLANSATTITASAANGTALQAITSGSAARVTSVYLKRRTGTGNIDLTQDNGSTWNTVSITASWARYEIAAVTSTNPTVGIRVVTSGDAVDIFGFQHEVGSFVTSLIPTTTASVTRAVDVCTLANSLYPYTTTEGTTIAVIEGIEPAASTFGMISTGVIGVAGTQFLYRGGNDWLGSIWSGPNVVANNSYTPGSVYKVAHAFKSGDSAVCANTVLTTSVSALTLANNTSMSIGDGGNVYIRQIIYIPRRVANAELQTRTT